MLPTQAVWLVRRPISAPVCGSQRMIVRSQLDEANIRLSGEYVSEEIQPQCLASDTSGRKESAAQI